MPDRFFNGDATNDRLGVAECFDPSNARRFHGGDVRGLTAKLSYLNDLGITTLWSTPMGVLISDLGPIIAIRDHR